MSNEWPDIPGLTGTGGQARLPRSPKNVVRLLMTAVVSCDGGGITLSALVAQVAKETGAEKQRLEGLAGWLPLSRVAAWNLDTGLLELDPSTDLSDLAMRYAAWAGSQPVPVDQVSRVEEYVRAILEESMLFARTMPPRKKAKPGTVAPVVEPPVVEEPPAHAPPLIPAELVTRIRSLLEVLDGAFLERSWHVRASLLALISGQHVLLLGPPGTAKSMLARAMCACFQDATYFEYLLSRFTTPDELFGPVSIPGLKEEDYRRLTEGFLPQAHVAFLDEIFKANSAILNSLLTLINERVFHHGRHRDEVPLLGLLGASNELPDPEGGLAALYDRFLVRLNVPPLVQAQTFLAVATGEVPELAVPAEARLTAEDLRLLRAAAEQVTVPRGVQDSLVALWRIGSRQEWEVSDRRWRQTVAMLKLGAAASGRRELSPLDLLLLDSVLAPTPDRTVEVREALLDQLGTGVVPQHDLRAQWILLRQDRVAPAPGLPVQPPPPGARWVERLARRRGSVERFLAHHQGAVERLAVDRQALEQQANGHLWLAALPVQVLSAHITGARDLARILRTTEEYADQLADPVAVARALVSGLPERSRRVYGHDIACTLAVAGAEVGLTLAGERVPPEQPLSAAPPPGVHVQGERVIVSLESTVFLDWIDGRVETRTLLAEAPAWAGRNAATALESARRLLGGQVVPTPPELPAP